MLIVTYMAYGVKKFKIWAIEMLSEKAQLIIDKKLAELKKSKFRSSFKLRSKELNYYKEKGVDVIQSHAYDFVRKKLAPRYPDNDGAQTPMKNHPVFIAQHATATCCRGCLEKWHHISKGQELTKEQQNYVVALIMTWIKREVDVRSNKNG